jgi:hypothetical protein
MAWQITMSEKEVNESCRFDAEECLSAPWRGSFCSAYIIQFGYNPLLKYKQRKILLNFLHRAEYAELKNPDRSADIFEIRREVVRVVKERIMTGEGSI